MKRVVLFQIGSQSYGLDLFNTRGIENYANVIMVPNAPENIQGMINIRKELIPVYNLRRKFHLKEADITADTKLIIGKIQGMTIAYLVDKVMGIEEVKDEDFMPVPVMLQSDDTGYMEAVIQAQIGLSILINQDGILTKDEKEQIERILEDMEKKKKAEEQKKTEEMNKKDEKPAGL